MRKKLTKWIMNASIQKKFIPLEIILIIMFVVITILSVASVTIVNNSTQNIIEVNVNNRESLNYIIREMYVCRVLGRDILLTDNYDTRVALYNEYLTAFSNLDRDMKEFLDRLEGDKYDKFYDIIEQKQIYEEKMILSADIRMEGGEFEEALEVLTSVTPIANEFFKSIDDFLLEEEELMTEAIDYNNGLTTLVILIGIVINILIINSIVFLIVFYSKKVSKNLIEFEKSVSEIAETGNMRIEIPKHLYTNDEVGRIAVVVDRMKSMLLDYSFTDTLTGGYNVKAYHEHLSDIFLSEKEEKHFWCIISDMNNLKLINDKLGHIEGDNAIKASYNALHNNLKQFGNTFRIGGDEFVSILFNCSEKEIEEKIAIIKDEVEEKNTDSIHKFSVASGYEEFKGSTKKEYVEFFKLVDKKMYKNKKELKQGRIRARISLENEE